MTRKDIDNILDNAETLDYGSQSGYECGMINNLIDKIYDDFENRSCDNCINASFEIKFGELEFNGCFLVSNGNICKWELKC